MGRGSDCKNGNKKNLPPVSKECEQYKDLNGEEGLCVQISGSLDTLSAIHLILFTINLPALWL
jgi:hypothetical protein